MLWPARVVVLAVGFLLVDAATCMADKNPDGLLIGRKISEFSLKDFRGHEHSLRDLQNKKLIIAFFAGTECPLAKLYGGRLQKLADEYSEHGVAVIGICSNAQDSLSDIGHYADKHDISYALLKDMRNEVADQFGATRTPQVFVLDQDRTIRYCGRIDGQFTFGTGVGLSAPAPKRHDLKVALDELLEGKEVSVPVTEVKGCLIGRERKVVDDATVTYTNQISRLFQKQCIECHREGQIGPFVLDDYHEASGWGEMIAEVIEEQRMPPWHANPAYGKFSNEKRLTDEEKQLVYRWVEDGCPEGDPSDLPPAQKYHEGWYMPRQPDQVFYISDERVDVKAEGVEDYRYYEMDPGFTEDKWVSIAECMPDNRAVVHHIIVYIREPGAKRIGSRKFRFLVGYAPGTRSWSGAKPGWARKIPAGSKLVFQMHYTPIGSPQTDRSSVGLIFCDKEEVEYQTFTTNVSNHRLKIPPHAENYRVLARKTFDRDTMLLSMFPHMHIRGKAFRYELNLPDGSSEILLDVPRYDFNWQNSFVLEEPKVIPKGAELLCTAYFDNSENNLANPNPDETVRWGDQTWEEMMIGWYDVARPVSDMEEDAKSERDADSDENSACDE